MSSFYLVFQTCVILYFLRISSYMYKMHFDHIHTLPCPNSCESLHLVPLATSCPYSFIYLFREYTLLSSINAAHICVFIEPSTGVLSAYQCSYPRREWTLSSQLLPIAPQLWLGACELLPYLTDLVLCRQPQLL